MATRVIESRRDRFITILVAPLMSCSARLPVYFIMTMAFVPAITYSLDAAPWMRVSLQGLVFFAMLMLGAVVAIPVAWLLGKTFFRGEQGSFFLELPDYKVPSIRTVLWKAFDGAKEFVVRAGTLIFATTIVIWALGYYPGDQSRRHELEARMESLPEDDAEQVALVEELNHESQRLINESYLGRSGQLIEPLVRPAGWDWRLGTAAIASFPAREVMVATLGTIFSLGGEVEADDQGLWTALQTAKWPDGRQLITLPVALSVMVFFALCAQCVSTLAIMKRETQSWGWTIFSFVYMTVLAYVGAIITYQVGSRLMS
jgi:ferrous iron transport protein B